MLSTDQGKAYFVAGGSLQVNEMLISPGIKQMILGPYGWDIVRPGLVPSGVDRIPDLHGNVVVNHFALKWGVRAAIAT
jgi:hypothetical protein